MTIEYTYPERPKDAKVHTSATYFMRHIVADADVPEVCEAMMALAGHEWQTQIELAIESQRAIEKAVAERIIARLKDNSYRTSSEGLSIVELPDALRIVREECGVAE